MTLVKTCFTGQKAPPVSRTPTEILCALNATMACPRGKLNAEKNPVSQRIVKSQTYLLHKKQIGQAKMQ